MKYNVRNVTIIAIKPSTFFKCDSKYLEKVNILLISSFFDKLTKIFISFYFLLNVISIIFIYKKINALKYESRRKRHLLQF